MVSYDISALDSPGFGYPRPTAINDHGAVCGSGTPKTGGASRPLVWDGAAAQSLPVPGNDGNATDINEAGHVAGYLRQANPHAAFVYANGALINVSAGVPGPESIALSINNHGLVAGWSGPIGAQRVFVYDYQQTKLLTAVEPLAGHARTIGGYINDAGEVVGLSQDANFGNARLFIHHDGKTEDLGTAEWVTGINASGTVVGSRSVNQQPWQAYRYTQAGPALGFEQLGYAGGGYIGSHGQGINDAGVVVGYSFPNWGTSAPWRPFVHFPAGHPDAGFHELDTSNINGPSGWAFESVSGINGKGQIVGFGPFAEGSNGQPTAYLLTPTAVIKSSWFDDYLSEFLILLGGVEVGAGGWSLNPRTGERRPIPPRSILPRELAPAERDLAIAQIVNRLAGLLSDATARSALSETALGAARKAQEILAGD